MKKIKQGGKKKRAFGRLALLNPRNLAREVHVYGYNFSWKSHALLLMCALVGISAIGILFELKPLYFSIVIVAVMGLLPMLILTSYKRMYEQKRFSDVVTYMEQMLYSFQKTKKVSAALTETRELFDGGMMREVIDRALIYLQKGYAVTEAGVLREALQLVEERYPCMKLHTVHELLASSEEYGGDADNSIQLLLANLELWKRRGYKLQANKKNSHTDNVISIIVATGFCVIALYILDGMQNMYPGNAAEMSIFKAELIQLSSLLFLIFMLYVLIKSLKNLATDWLQTERMHKTDVILESYHKVMNYDEAREKRKSVIWATPLFVGAAVSFFAYSKWVGMLMLAFGAFMLCQHKIGYRLAKKDVNEELYFSLPQWLMEMALLLQNNNVQVSIAKSVDGAPSVLREELKLLMERLHQAPDKLKSYTDFCKEFDIPEAGSCMKVLHAISESGTGSASVQIANLIQRVNEMQDIADEIRNGTIAYKAKVIFSYPLIGCTVKLLTDLSVGMLSMFHMLGNLGGM